MTDTFSIRELAYVTRRPAAEIARLLNHAGARPAIPTIDTPVNLRIPRNLVSRAALVAAGKTKGHLQAMLDATGPPITAKEGTP